MIENTDQGEAKALLDSRTGKHQSMGAGGNIHVTDPTSRSGEKQGNAKLVDETDSVKAQVQYKTNRNSTRVENKRQSVAKKDIRNDSIVSGDYGEYNGGKIIR